VTGRSIILPGEVGAQIEPRLTVDGLRDLIQDWRTAGKKIPTYIVVSEYDRRDLNQDLCAGAKALEGDDVERPDHDGKAIGFIEGVMVRSHPDVPRGKARFVYSAEKRSIENRLGGEGLIIVGANA
jgi:hypothetical protein